MANCYWGDGFSAPHTLNSWNDPLNWYSTPGIPSGCCAGPGTPLGRVPSFGLGDNPILYGFGSGGAGAQVLSIGPTGGWPGTLTVGSSFFGCSLAAGTFGGAVVCGGPGITGSINGVGVTLTGSLTLGAGGVVHAGNINCNVTLNGGLISGGTFTGLFSLGASAHNNSYEITGGTWSPVENVNLEPAPALAINPAGIPHDPGFAITPAAVYSPTLDTPNNVYPTPAQVKTGVTYGPTSADYTGTFAGGAPVPAIKKALSNIPIHSLANFAGMFRTRAVRG